MVAVRWQRTISEASRVCSFDFRGLGEEIGRSWEGKISVERRGEGSGDVGQKIYEKEGREGIETVAERRGPAESSTRFFHRL